MATKKTVYTVEVKADQAKARAEAQKLSAIFASELKKISIGGSGATGGSSTAQAKADAAVRIAAAKAESAERINASRAYAARGIESEKQLTLAVRTEADRRQHLARLEAAILGDASGVGRARAIENEKRYTMAFKAEIAERQRQAKLEDAANRNRNNPLPGVGGGVTGALIKGAAGYLTIQAARQAGQYALAISDARTANLRAASSFQILAGSAKEADAQLRAIRSASGTIDKLTAQQIAVQANALKLADTAKEMEAVTRAAREVTLVSATIGDVQSALTELSIFAANPKNFARSDQLGLDQGSIKDRMKELMTANVGMDESTAKLQATIQLLDERYGALLDSQAAAASGAENLRRAWADLKAELSQSTIAGLIDGGLNQLAGSIDRARVAAGSTDATAQQSAIDQSVKNAQVINAGLAAVPGLGSLDLAGQRAWEQFSDNFKTLFDAANDNVIGIENYREAATRTLADVSRQFGIITEAQQASMQTMAAASANASESNMRVADTSQAAAEAAAYQRQQVEGLAEQYIEMGGEIAAFAQGLVISGANVKDFNERIAGMAEFFDKKAGVKEGATSGAAELVKRFGVEEANRILEEQLQQIEVTFQRFQRQGIRGGPLLDLSIEALAGSLSTQVDQIIAEADRLANAGNFDTAVDQINTALARLNSGSFDGMDGISGLRNELVSLWDTISFTGTATDEQTQRIAYLASVAYAATDSTSTLSQIQAILGVEFLNTNSYASGLVEQIIMLDAAQAAGKIGALEHAGGLGVLTGEIYNTANAAGLAAGPLAQLLALRNALNVASAGSVNLPAFQRGQDMGTGAAMRERLLAGQASRDQMREQQDRAAKEAAKGFKSAASSAARDFNSAAKATKTAFENVAKSIESALRNVEGLFSISEVTQEDLDLAAAGGKVDKADNWRRRLEDEIKNGKDWADVSIEQARDALQRVGIDASGPAEQILAQINKAWNDQSLFADKANLSLIDADVVRQQLQLQDKIKTGQQNILDMFGATVDGVIASVKSGDATVTGMVASELEGSGDKQAQEMAKGLREQNQAIIAKAIEYAFAEPMDTSAGGGGGGGGGGSIELPEIPVWDPSAYLDPLVDAGNKLGDPAFFAGFDSFKKGADNLATWSAALTMPGMPATLPGGQAGPLPQAMPGAAAMAAIAGPSLTADPATATNYMKALALQFEAKAGEADALGKTIGATIGGGMDTADLAVKATEYITALDLAFDVVDKAYIGTTIGGQIASGMASTDFTGKATNYMQKLAAQFATPEVASVPLAIGDTLAFLQDAGYNEHDHSGMALAYLEKLSAQYGTIAPNMTAIGYNNATFVGFGFGDYDPAPLADSMVDDMKAAFETERNYSLLFSAGRHMVDPIVAGFKEGAAYSPWLQIIAEEVTGQALDMQAQATTDAQAAVVVTGAGVQR